MLIRLLVVVLTLVGPLPCRACTCAAHPVHAAHDEPASAPETAAPKESCGCDHDETDPADADDHSAPPRDSHHQHERDCPATDPTPVVRDAVTSPAVDPPTDCAEANAGVWVKFTPFLTPSVLCRPAPPRPPKLPLYLTLLSLRN